MREYKHSESSGSLASGWSPGITPISYPESSGFLVSRWAPVETLGNSQKSTQRLPLFYHRNLAVTEFQYPRVSTGAHPLTKKPEDSGYEIGITPAKIEIMNTGSRGVQLERICKKRLSSKSEVM